MKERRGGGVQYGYDQFKAHAEGYIKRLYNGVQVGKKAVFVPGNSGRRNADIIVCQEFRRYTAYEPGNVRYDEGVAFFSGGNRIDNFPKQYSANCTLKNQATGGNYKPMVRVFKNMRNTMIEQGYLAQGVAPSYFIEGMLWNVPTNKFVRSYGDMFVSCYNWVVNANVLDLVCANGLHWLVRDKSSVCWPTTSFKTFTAALKSYWES